MDEERGPATREIFAIFGATFLTAGGAQVRMGLSRSGRRDQNDGCERAAHFVTAAPYKDTSVTHTIPLTEMPLLRHTRSVRSASGSFKRLTRNYLS